MKLAILDANERFYADKCSLEKKLNKQIVLSLSKIKIFGRERLFQKNPIHRKSKAFLSEFLNILFSSWMKKTCSKAQ